MKRESNRFSIIGINGSPRKANTDILLKAALEEVAGCRDIEVETINLRDGDIQFCRGCFRCNGVNEYPSGCPVHRDAMDEIVPRLKVADGIILASPVYFGGVTAQMKCFMDRTESLLRYAPGPRTGLLRNKVGAAIVVGGNRNGGQEAAIQGIHHFFMIHDMVVVGTGPEKQPGCYLGAAGFSGMDPERGSLIKDAVMGDSLGLRAAGILGRRVAEMARIIRFSTNGMA